MTNIFFHISSSNLISSVLPLILEILRKQKTNFIFIRFVTPLDSALIMSSPTAVSSSFTNTTSTWRETFIVIAIHVRFMFGVPINLDTPLEEVMMKISTYIQHSTIFVHVCDICRGICGKLKETNMKKWSNFSYSVTRTINWKINHIWHIQPSTTIHASSIVRAVPQTNSENNNNHAIDAQPHFRVHPKAHCPGRIHRRSK